MPHDPCTTPYDNTKPLPRDGSPTFGAPTPEDCARSWLRHVEAGRIGRQAPMQPENLRTIVRNELAMFGRRY
ncbi:hypothetical protein SAMN06297468_0113 [Altererythrobacter xiamenensis]|uniref:Uncharacterized protein n=1 Tax=Altererythrobacter xiamenensis TaxID=1316679 RepID=A0A1Y6E5T5_9SPHN|nr:hypothetical protein [Altererythrobacter xiamenensis]SMQ58108.1 hypothetical protein SAMN06297468_0113 [Altererythrobacter xiamenensis]